MKRLHAVRALATILIAGMLACAVAQDDLISQHSTDYLSDTSLAVPAGDEVDTSPYATEGPYTIGFINWSSANSWTVQVTQEAEHEASLYPQIERFLVASSEGDANRQIAQIEDMIVRGVDALIVVPVAPDAIAPALEEAADAGIPIVTFGAEANTDAMVTELLTDPLQFGFRQGQWLMEQLDCEGNIIVLNGAAGVSTSDNRRAGLQQAIDDCPDGGAGINVLAEADAGWAYDQGRLETERLLAAYPDIDGVWSQGGAMTQGAIDAFEAANRPLVPMTGEDNNGFMIAWQERIPDGFEAMAASEPTWQSRLALQVALRILQGETVNSFYRLQVPTIFEDEVGDYVRPDLNDSFWTNTRLPEDLAQELYGR